MSKIKTALPIRLAQSDKLLFLLPTSQSAPVQMLKRQRHLMQHHLPLLMRTAGDVSAEWALWQSRPHVEVDRPAEGA